MGECRRHKRVLVLLAAFTRLRTCYPPEVKLHMVMDNLNTHRHPVLRAFFDAHQITVVPTPTYALAEEMPALKCRIAPNDISVTETSDGNYAVAVNVRTDRLVEPSVVSVDTGPVVRETYTEEEALEIDGDAYALSEHGAERTLQPARRRSVFSREPEAQRAAREIPPCMVFGQAAGAAVALAREQGGPCRRWMWRSCRAGYGRPEPISDRSGA